MKKKILLVIVALFSLFVVLGSFGCGNNVVNRYKVTYATDGNGTIQGEAEQSLQAGEQTTDVTAIPNEGYQFVKWSDNKTQSTRSDIVNNSDLTFTAKFEKKVFTVNYSSTEFGIIYGKTTQSVKYGESSEAVTAKPLYGYKFVGWSDGVTTAERTDANVTCNISATATYEKITFIHVMQYLTDGNGEIDGRAKQNVFLNTDAEPVTAVPNDGYEFVQWSDGVTTATRRDLNVENSITVTAQFKRVFVRYKLNYRLGESDTDITEFKFYDGNFETVDFPVPQRELFTFGGWYIGDEQVADTNGKMIVGEELLEKEGKEIYAKWTANVNYTYKILMVYVTELDATVQSVRGNGDFDVYYKMSDFDIKVCKTVTKQVSNCLNDMLDGLVTFEVDEYFTTVPVGSESFKYDGEDNYIFAIRIPEIKDSGIYKKYQSILTVFGLDDYDMEFCSSSGVATDKYGCVFLESVYEENLINNDPLENLLDLNYWRWYSIIEPFIHELAHTLELQIYDSYLYHSIIRWAHAQLMYDHILMNKLYFLNMIEIDGKKVGIPIEFWSGELELFTREDW